MKGGLVHFNMWAEGEAEADPKMFVIAPTVPQEFVWNDRINRNVALRKAAKDVRFYTLNGNVALVTYQSQLGTVNFELWHLSHPSVQLTLPNCDSCLIEGEYFMESDLLDWLLDTNSNSEYLVRLYCRDSIAIFVLVFDGFTSCKYRHRITMPLNVEEDNINLRILGTGKDAKTVLTAQTENPYRFYVYDLSNGQKVLTIPLDRYHTCCGQYLFPTHELNIHDHRLGGVDVIQIDCKSQNWSISTNFAYFPPVEDYLLIRLVKVTETQTMWLKDDINDGSSTSIICDYLLNDVD